MKVANTLAYYDMATITAVKKYRPQVSMLQQSRIVLMGKAWWSLPTEGHFRGVAPLGKAPA